MLQLQLRGGNENKSDLKCINHHQCNTATLFNVFINRLSKLLADTNIEHLLFADDLVDFVPNTDFQNLYFELSRALDTVHSWCSISGVQINFSKSKFMLIGKPSTFKFPNANKIFSDSDHYIDRVYSFKYLGIWLDDCLNFKLHAENVLDNVCSSLQCLSKHTVPINGCIPPILIIFYYKNSIFLQYRNTSFSTLLNLYTRF